MSEASDLIERAERESGKRWDDPDGGGIEIMFGALVREMGARGSRFQSRDDYMIGILIQDQFDNGDRRRAADNALLALLDLGLSPDDIYDLLK